MLVGELRHRAPATRFAFVRRGSAAGAATITQALREHGVDDDTRITVLSDGDAGLRAIQRAAAPETVLDWFHIAMRWQHVQLATGAIHQGQTAEARTWLLDLIERAKWPCAMAIPIGEEIEEQLAAHAIEGTNPDISNHLMARTGLDFETGRRPPGS